MPSSNSALALPKRRDSGTNGCGRSGPANGVFQSFGGSALMRVAVAAVTTYITGADASVMTLPNQFWLARRPLSTEYRAGGEGGRQNAWLPGATPLP